jgi:hypothetical protein
MAGHDNEVDVVILGNGDDLLGCIAVPAYKASRAIRW